MTRDELKFKLLRVLTTGPLNEIDERLDTLINEIIDVIDQTRNENLRLSLDAEVLRQRALSKGFHDLLTDTQWLD